MAEDQPIKAEHFRQLTLISCKIPCEVQTSDF